jgi:signal transduction histidine kinase
MNRIIKYFVLLLLVLKFPTLLYGQTPAIEALQQELTTSSGKDKVDKLVKLGLLQVGYNQNEALNSFLAAEKEAKQLKYFKGEASAKRFIGQCYAIQRNVSKAKWYYSESLKIYKRINSNADVADLMFNLARLQFETTNDYEKNKQKVDSLLAFCNVYTQKAAMVSAYLLAGDVEYSVFHNKEAISNYFKAVKTVSQDKKLLDRKGFAYSKIASLYNDLGDYEKAYKYQLKSVAVYRELNGPELAIGLINLGQTLDGFEKKEEATKYYREALNLATKVNNQHYIALSEENLSRNLYLRKKYKESVVYAESSLVIYRGMGNTSKVASSLALAAKSYYELKQYAKAEAYVNEGLANPYSEKVKADLYLLHSKLMEKAHKDGDALASFKRYVTFQDSIRKIEDKQNAEDLLVKYDTKFKEYQNELLTKDVKFKELQLSTQHKTITYLILGLVLLVLLLFMVYQLFSSKKKSNRILAAQKKELAVANSQLNEAIKTKDKFFSILSHDLRDPVISMQSFGRMMTTKYEFITEEERRELIEDNLQSSNSLHNLLEELLVWARCQTGTIYPVYERVKLKDFLADLSHAYAPIAARKEIAIEFNFEVTGKILMDKSMLATILRNLLSNAIKFSYLHGKIEVSYALEEEWLVFSVKDEGTGMTEEELNNLFSITSSFSKEGTAKERGSGLGLIICHEFTAAMGGEILIKSEKGKGTTFSVKLPLNRNAETNNQKS